MRIIVLMHASDNLCKILVIRFNIIYNIGAKQQFQEWPTRRPSLAAPDSEN